MPPNDAYLRNAVMTATPEQLHLMLYDGAIRFARQAQQALHEKRFEDSFNALTKAQRIVLEMTNGLNHEINPDLCAKMAGLYNFIYRKLVDANVSRDATAVDDALRILGYQRETWGLLVDKLKGDREDAPTAHTSPGPADAPVRRAPLSVEG